MTVETTGHRAGVRERNIDMLEVTFAGAFLAGLLSFVSPCVLPIVPPYLCYLTGMSFEELSGENTAPPGAARAMTAMVGRCAPTLGV